MQTNHLSTELVIQRIANLVRRMMTFWKSVHGWAPIEAAGLLSKSMLTWQASLADSLINWNRPLSDGNLILAWVNVGALVEGQLKLFLSVYYNDYQNDSDAIKHNGTLRNPDALNLEKLRVFFKKKVWVSSDSWDEWILSIQRRRNAVHAFEFKDIGTTEDLHSNLLTLLLFINDISSRLPYPDGIAAPHEYEY